MASAHAWIDASKSLGLVLCVGACVALSCASGNESSITTQTGASVGAGASSADVGVVAASATGTSTSTGMGGASASSTSSGTGAQSSVSSSGPTTSSQSASSSASSGNGGATTSSSSSSSSSSGSGGQGGAAPTGTIVLLAGPNVFTAEFHAGAGWTTGTLPGTTDVGPAIAMTSATSAVGVIRSSANAGEIDFTTWTPGTFAPLAAISGGVTTAATPAIAAQGPLAQAAFIGDDFKHYYAAHLVAWAPVAEPIGAPQSFGPTAPSITADGNDAVVAYAGNDGDLYDQTRTGGVWQAAHAHMLGAVAKISPTIVTPTSGSELMIVFVRSTDSKIVYTVRSAGVWSAPAPIDPTALSADPIAVAALPGGEAIAAYRGTDSMIYASRYTPNGAPAWSAPAGIAVPNVSTPSSPAIAAGVGGLDAELVFIAASGAATHTRLGGVVWSAPTLIGGPNLTHVAIASAP